MKEKYEVHDILIAIGTNTRQKENLQKAKTMLCRKFGDARFSSALWTQPIDIKSEVFLNALASAKTSLSRDETTAALKEMEKACGNTRALRDEGIIVTDLDLMAYDNEKLHIADWERPYIKALAKELNDNNK